MANYKIGVVGAGNMGAGIAQKLAQEELDVILVDMNDEKVQKGLETISSTLTEGVERGIFTEEQKTETLNRIYATSKFDDLTSVDLVIEAVFEDLKVKGSLFQKLDDLCESKTIFATNTSSLFVKDIAQFTQRPDRFIGMHYFYHPAKNRLVEVIPHENTSKETIEKTMLIGKLHNKTCILVKDSPGFAVNRYFVPFLNESVHLLEEGVANIPTIDAAAKEAFEIGMGPFELMNVTGLPIAEHSSSYLSKEISEFYAPAALLKEKVNNNDNWPLEGEIVEQHFPFIKKRLFATVFGIAASQVDEGVASIEDTDIGAKVGLKWKLGPFELMNKYGLEEAYEAVEELNESRVGFHDSSLLKEQAQKNQPFSFQFIQTEIKNGIAYLTINRPEAMNALNPVVVEQLEQAFDQAESSDKVKGIAIQGAGKSFVAGADINFFIDCIENNQIEKNVAFTRKGHYLFRKLETSNKVTVAVLDGLSLGGGSELALACQHIVATNQGSLAFPESGLGIYPGLGGMLRMNHQIGEELTKYFVMTGKTIRANTALELQLVSDVVEMEDIEATIETIVEKGTEDKYKEREIPASLDSLIEAFSEENVQKMLNGEKPKNVDPELAEKLVKILSYKGPIALKTINDLINKQVSDSIEEGIELELDYLMSIFKTQDALNGLVASTTGSRPEFVGEGKKV
ncbi:3-hydroxyacyl-CoA dehydrogenase/enoyl-CoA hydratase family protein [Salsuginibacillus kocurii]|uniref:3-hydroxyacyl-CoA dehydrogenase/enoyl-CoA hydratase family protein n=1 Tax=Salsuginibacillus kocurii TaxID=427078 RepID=UPI00035F9A61|nr:3-hydroxyacyl-CoA dehydrogenase/enoyl-CoA hydratase family protein [Salsuginibacillus kocurii]